jgi:hypothetical protein
LFVRQMAGWRYKDQKNTSNRKSHNHVAEKKQPRQVGAVLTKLKQQS